MTQASPRLRPSFCIGGILVAVMLAAGGARSAATRAAPAFDQAAEPTAAKAFADAPDGVDPMVTGPVSATFRQRQEAAGCSEAVWPDIPMACYPD
jgi:hypothetical protein